MPIPAMSEKKTAPFSELPILRFLVIAFLGGICGFLAELVHLRAGVWTLPEGTAPPWWIGIVYFLGIFAAGLAFSGIERYTRYRLSVSLSILCLEGLLFAALFLAPPLLYRHEGILAAIALAYLALRLLFFRAPGDPVVAATAMAVDFALESALVAASLYHYPCARWMHLPLWLAPLWGGLALGLRRLFLAASSGFRGKRHP
jgi:hypothetical protein